MASILRNPVKRYATFQPDKTSPYVMYGEATLFPGYGYVFQADGCDWTMTVSYRDIRLTLGHLVTESPEQLPLIQVA